MLGAAVLHFSGLALVGAALRRGRAHWTHQGAKARCEKRGAAASRAEAFAALIRRSRLLRGEQQARVELTG